MKTAHEKLEGNASTMSNRIAKMNTTYNIKSGSSTILINSSIPLFLTYQTAITNLIFSILAFDSITKLEKQLIPRKNVIIKSH